MREHRFILVDHRFEGIHEARRDLNTPYFLSEIELADLRRLVRMNDDKPRLIHDNELPRVVRRHLRQGIVKIVETDCPCHNTREDTVLHDRHSNDCDHLAGDRRDHRFGDHRLLCLNCLFEVIPFRTIKGAAVCVKADAVHT